MNQGGFWTLVKCWLRHVAFGCYFWPLINQSSQTTTKWNHFDSRVLFDIVPIDSVTVPNRLKKNSFLYYVFWSESWRTTESDVKEKPILVVSSPSLVSYSSNVTKDVSSQLSCHDFTSVIEVTSAVIAVILLADTGEIPSCLINTFDFYQYKW